MNYIDDETSSHKSGYITPPLSPTKTVSTADWLSPRTPESPRKARSCLFFQDIDNGLDSAFLTPPSSLTKCKSLSFLGSLSSPELIPSSCNTSLAHSDNDSPLGPKAIQSHDKVPSHLPLALARLHSRYLLHTHHRSVARPGTPSNTGVPSRPQHGSSSTTWKGGCRSLSERFLVGPVSRSSPTPVHADTTSQERKEPSSLNCTNQGAREDPSTAKLHQLPLRYDSSPLRPGQWVTRGGKLSLPRRSQASNQDRFISSRRPFSITRESFELNKPKERVKGEKMVFCDGSLAPNAFSRQLRRSGRLNDELRGLREAHSLTFGRANMHPRNANFSPLPLNTRQVSTGAVWNVGGPSAVSDTVIGVSTGRGGILGSGTNAPLYKSAFLDRADPEAEILAYQQRLALALDVDQTDRVLQHSPTTSRLHSTEHSDMKSHANHVWRDGAWIKDGVYSRSCSSLSVCFPAWTLTNLLKHLVGRIKFHEGLFQSCHLDAFP